jgi:phage terminase large subunit-like protein
MHEKISAAEELQMLMPKTEEDIENFLNAIKFKWELHRRDSQWPPEDDSWHTWLFLGGRGSGKTRAGAELVRHWIESGHYRLGHFIAPTMADVRDVMLEGDSGIMTISPPWMRPTYHPSKRQITWPNGAKVLLFSADEPERLRGPQCEFLWADEPASWRRPETWDMAMFGLRLGELPRAIVTGTPKPTKLILGIMKQKTTYLSRGSTYDNLKNLAPQFVEYIKDKYEGTRLGRQEIHAEVLMDNAKALWKREWIENNRLPKLPDGVTLTRVVVAVDPSNKGEKDSDEAGIVVAGKGSDLKYYVIDDQSLIATPKGWATKAVNAYTTHTADRIIYEANQGGDMVKETFEAVNDKVPLKEVWASRGKATRAEPVSALYEQNRVVHVGAFPDLEDELCQWEPGDDSPNRLDALVYGITALHGQSGKVSAQTGLNVHPDE